MMLKYRDRQGLFDPVLQIFVFYLETSFYALVIGHWFCKVVSQYNC